MRTNSIFLLIVTLMITACSDSTFYQLYKTESPNLESNGERLMFENDEIRVIYDLWDNAGNSSFIVHNKTNSDVFIDLKNSHLIVNGMAKTYFQNRSFSESTSSSFSSDTYYSSSLLKGISNSLASIYSIEGMGSAYSTTNAVGSVNTTASKNKSTVAEGFSVTYREKDVVLIPSNAAKIFSGFSLKDAIYRDCDLLRFPSKKKISTLNFNQESTPLNIRNVISYGFDIGNEQSFTTLENYFWASEITNYPESEFTELRKPEYCDETSDYSQRFFKYFGPDMFYIEYVKEMGDEFKH